MYENVKSVDISAIQISILLEAAKRSQKVMQSIVALYDTHAQLSYFQCVSQNLPSYGALSSVIGV